MAKMGWPVTIFLRSTPGCEWPMILYSLGSFSLSEARFGVGMEAALVANSPYDSDLPLHITRPEDVVQSDGCTPHVWAAAAMNMARAPAPTWRIGTQFVGVAVLPPALWPAYLDSTKSA